MQTQSIIHRCLLVSCALIYTLKLFYITNQHEELEVNEGPFKYDMVLLSHDNLSS